MKKRYSCIISVIVALMIANTIVAQSAQEPTPKVHRVILREIIQTTKYTYLNVMEDTAYQWLAVPSIEFSIGDTLYYQGGMVMPDFKSKELNRTFNKVIFLEIVSKTEEGTKKTSKTTPEHNAKPKQSKLDIKVDPAPGGITVAELFANKEQYSGKTIKIRAQVVRFKSGILGKNWIHLQDGTASGDKFDLTATIGSNVAVGDIITVESKVTLNKDFGSGYFFDVILEDATIL